MIKWQYCLVYGKKVQLFTSGGTECQSFPNDESAAFALGEDGWELVTVHVSGTMYFKKPHGLS